MIRVLLTGGTGSFGVGFTRMLADNAEDYHVRVYSRDEHKQAQMRLEFSGCDKVAFYIGDVRDRDRLERAMSGCDWVVHAAALKQAPLGEIEAEEFIKTNVMGSINVVEAARRCAVKRALLVSTDKAVEPINLYGATKMCAEKVFLQADHMRETPTLFHPTRFACTRYGNVAGTNGSVIPTFLRLPDDKLTPITDPQATRFWITLKEANKFVFDVINMRPDAFGGKVHFPRLKSVRVIDIARAVRPGHAIEIVGLRPGDKLHEVLSIDGERYSSDKNEFLEADEIRSHVFGGRPRLEAGVAS